MRKKVNFWTSLASHFSKRSWRSGPVISPKHSTGMLRLPNGSMNCAIMKSRLMVKKKVFRKSSIRLITCIAINSVRNVCQNLTKLSTKPSSQFFRTMAANVNRFKKILIIFLINPMKPRWLFRKRRRKIKRRRISRNRLKPRKWFRNQAYQMIRLNSHQRLTSTLYLISGRRMTKLVTI